MDIPGLRVFQSLLKAEQNVMSAAVTLSQMAARGAHGRDFDFLVNQYREQKTALYGREMFLYNQLINFINTGNAFDNINIVARYSREYIISLIPRPQLLPDIPTQPTAASRSGRSGTSGLSGPEIVIAGVAINPWVAILLAIVVIAVIIGAMYFAETYFEASKIAEESTQQFSIRSQTYAVAWNQCLNKGFNPDTCAENINPPEPTLSSPWIKTGLILGGTVLIGGLLVYLFKDKLPRRLATSKTDSNPAPTMSGGYYLAVNEDDEDD